MFKRCVFLLVLLTAALGALPALAQQRDTFVSKDGTVLFMYPTGWATQDLGRMVVLASAPELLRVGAPLGSDGLRATLVVAAPGDVHASLDARSRPADVLAVVTGVTHASTCGGFGLSDNARAGDRDAVLATQTCSATENVVLVVQVDAGIVAVIQATTPRGGTRGATDDLLDISGSLQYDPEGRLVAATPAGSDLPLTYVSRDSTVRFSYPNGWTADEDNGSFGIALGDEGPFPFDDQKISATLTLAERSSVPRSSRGSAADIAQWLADGNDWTIDGPDPLDFGDRDAAVIALTRLQGIDVQIIIAELNDDVLMRFDMVAPTGELAPYVSVLTAVARTVEFNPDGFDSSTPPTTLPGVGDVDLTQNFTAPDDSFTLSYPDGWFVTLEDINNFEVVILRNFRRFRLGDLNSGEVFVFVVLQSVGDITGRRPDSDPAQRPLDAMQALNDNSSGRYTDPVGFELDGRFGARTDALGGGVDFSAFILMLDDDLYAYFGVYAPEDELEQHVPTLLAVLASVEASGTPSGSGGGSASGDDLGSTTVSQTGGFSVAYPDGWGAEEQDGLIAMDSRDGELTMVVGVSPYSGTPDIGDLLIDFLGTGSRRDVVTFDIGTRSAARLTEDSITSIALFLDRERFAVALIFHPMGDFEDYEDLILAIIESIQVIGGV